MQPTGPSYKSRRSNPRYKTRLRTLVRVGSNEFSCDLLDISAGGAGLQTCPSLLHLAKKREWHLEVPGFVTVPALRMWQIGSRVGLRFDITAERRQSIATKLVALANTCDDVWLSED